jgi:hypothetical protein
LTDELISEFNTSVAINLLKAKLIHFQDERGWSAIATDYIKRKEELAGIPIFPLSSFDDYSWYDVFKSENYFFRLLARLVFERFARYEIKDPVNWYVHSLPSTMESFLLWTDD